MPDVDLSKLGRTVIGASKKFEVEVIDSCEDLVALYRTVFDIEKIAAFVQRSNFSFTFDALSGGACQALHLQHFALHDDC